MARRLTENVKKGEEINKTEIAGAQAPTQLAGFAARINPCPDTRPYRAEFFAACEAPRIFCWSLPTVREKSLTYQSCHFKTRWN